MGEIFLRLQLTCPSLASHFQLWDISQNQDVLEMTDHLQVTYQKNGFLRVNKGVQPQL